MSIVNRRNAVLGWAVWSVGKRTAKKKAKNTAHAVEGSRRTQSLIAAGIAATVGTLAFWRKKKSGETPAA